MAYDPTRAERLKQIRNGYFSFANRGTVGHWDISDGKKRLFCIRGEPGDYGISDETGLYLVLGTLSFSTPEAAMGYLCDLLGHGVE